MNIIDAIKSGRRFRRKAWSKSKCKEQRKTWLEISHDTDEILKGDYRYSPSKEDALADDWEIEEQTVTITRKQLEKAFWSTNGVSPNAVFSFLAGELGFDDE